MRKYQRLTIDEREKITGFLSQGKSLRSIALSLSRNVSTISRELIHFRKNCTAYKGWFAQGCSEYLSTNTKVKNN